LSKREFPRARSTESRIKDAFIKTGNLFNYFPVIPAQAGVQQPAEFYSLGIGSLQRAGRDYKSI